MWRRGRTEKESTPETTHLCGRYVFPCHLVANSRRLLPQSRRQRRPAPPATATLLLLRRVSPARGSRLRSRRRRGQRRHRRLPTGFHPGAAAAGTRGCGALVCARALLDGVPNMIFRDSSSSSSNPDPEPVLESESGPADMAAEAAPPAEERAASSDLPPRADRVADLFEGDGVGERVGRRGWKKCRGCVTRDVACTRW